MGHVDTDSTRRWRSGFARTYSRSSGWHVSRSPTVSRLRARVADGRRPERAARDVPNVSACGFRPGVSSVHVSRVSVASRGEAIDRTDQSVLFGFASRFSRFPPRRRFFRSRPRRLVRVIRASRTERTRRDAVEAQTASTHAHGGTWSVAVAPGGGRRVIVTRAGDAGSPDSESKDDSSREVRFAPDDRRSSDTDDVAPSRVRPRVGHV